MQESTFVNNPDDCYISYLPLAHMMERSVHVSQTPSYDTLACHPNNRPQFSVTDPGEMPSG